MKLGKKYKKTGTRNFTSYRRYCKSHKPQPTHFLSYSEHDMSMTWAWCRIHNLACSVTLCHCGGEGALSSHPLSPLLGLFSLNSYIWFLCCDCSWLFGVCMVGWLVFWFWVVLGFVFRWFGIFLRRPHSSFFVMQRVCLFARDQRLILLMNSQENPSLRIILDSGECDVYLLCGFVGRNVTDNLWSGKLQN